MPATSTFCGEDGHGDVAPTLEGNANVGSSNSRRAKTRRNRGLASELGHQYPRDPPGEAVGDNGRVWWIYRDRVEAIDEALLESWNDTLNMLLVFAGLFSAACTAFVIEISKSLQPDWQRATSLAVYAIYAHLNSTTSQPFDVPIPHSFTAPSNVRWISGLWFTSLTLSLVVSLLAILAKQWLNEFKSRMRAPVSSPRMWALRHNAFKTGLERWGMSAFISAMPLFLHAALFLFLTGLCLFLQPLDVYIASAVFAISGLVCLFYIVAGLTPLFSGDCPSATPGLRHVYTLGRDAIVPATLFAFKVLATPVAALPGIVAVIISLIYVIGLAVPFHLFCQLWFLCFPAYRMASYELLWGLLGGWLSNLEGRALMYCNMGIVRALWRYRLKLTVTPAFYEENILVRDVPLWEASALSWMIRMLPVEDDIIAALRAVGFLPVGDHHVYFTARKMDSPLVHPGVQKAMEGALESIATRPEVMDDAVTGSLLRACVVVSLRPPNFSDRAKKYFLKYADDMRLAKTKELQILRRLSRFVSSNAIMPTQDSSPHPNWLIGRFVVIVTDMCDQRNRKSMISAIATHIREGTIPYQGGSRTVDSKLKTLIDMGRNFNRMHWVHSDVLPPGEVALYVGVAKVLVSDRSALIPRDLQDQLHFITTPPFVRAELSTEDISVLFRLILRADPEGLSCIRPIVLRSLLFRFRQKTMSVLTEVPPWIRAAFQISSTNIEQTLALWQYLPAELTLPGSHLSLLEPIALSPWPTVVYSPWKNFLDIIPISDTADVVLEMACGYSILLLAMQRRGYSERARTMLRELLPNDLGATILARGTNSRYHLALHASLIDPSRWEEFSAALLETVPDESWTACEAYPDADTFVNAIQAQNDCLECPHEETNIEWDSATWLPNTNKTIPEVPAQDPAVSPLPTAAIEPHLEPVDSPEALEEPAEPATGKLATAVAEEEEDRLERGQRV